MLYLLSLTCALIHTGLLKVFGFIQRSVVFRILIGILAFFLMIGLIALFSIEIF